MHYFEPGDSLYGMLVATHRLNGPQKKPRFKSLRSSLISAFHPFGSPAILVAAMEELGELPTHEFHKVLCERTTFGFYASGKTDPFARVWSKNLLTQGTYPGNRSYPFTRVGQRWCPRCHTEALKDFRISVWKVIHQIPYVHHCPYHGCALLFACEDCNTVSDVGSNMQLPGDACRRCGSTSFASLGAERSPGYLSLISHVKACYEGNLPWIRADTWYAYLSRAVAQLRIRHKDPMTVIEATILKRWAVSTTTQLADRIFGEASDHVFNITDSESSLSSPLLIERFLIADALQHHKLPFSAIQDEVLTPPPTSSPSPSNALKAKLLQRAFDMDLRPSVVDHIFSNKGIKKVAKLSGVKPQALSEDLLKGATDELHSQIQSAIDEGYLAPHIVKRRGRPVFETRVLESHKKTLKTFVKINPTLSRQQIRNAVSTAYSVVRKLDPSWLNQHLPPKAEFIVERTLRTHLGALQNFVATSYDLTRQEFERQHPSSHYWLRRYQPDIFNSNLLKGEEERVKSTRDTHEFVLEYFLKTHPNPNRSTFHKSNPGASAWLRRNEWAKYEAALPKISTRSRNKG